MVNQKGSLHRARTRAPDICPPLVTALSARHGGFMVLVSKKGPCFFGACLGWSVSNIIILSQKVSVIGLCYFSSSAAHKFGVFQHRGIGAKQGWIFGAFLCWGPLRRWLQQEHLLGLCMWLAPWFSCTPMVMDLAAFWQAGGGSGSAPLPGQWCILSNGVLSPAWLVWGALSG